LDKNTKTYLLLALVLVIWGIIGYRILSTISPEPAEQLVMSEIAPKPFKTVKRDTFSIKADYRDPFLGTANKPESKKKIRRSAPKKEFFDIDVHYTGSLLNSSTGQRIFFVTVNGQQFLMEKGKQAQEVTLVNGSESAITVRYKGIRKKIELER
tara:strand:+ start:460 stop:921 length:462 start_codon:yes stop_codon:yes gene_type:complete